MAIIKLAWGRLRNGWLDLETEEIGLPKALLESGEGRVLERSGENGMTLSVRDDNSSLYPTGTYDPRGHYQFAPKTPGLNNRIFIPIGIDPREQKIDEEYPIIIASTLKARLMLVPTNGRALQEALLDDFESFTPNCEFDKEFLDPRTLQPDVRHIEVMGHKKKYGLDYTRFVDTIERVRYVPGVLGRLGFAKVRDKWVSVSSSGIIEAVHEKNPIVASKPGQLGFGTIKKVLDGKICIYTSNDRMTLFSAEGDQEMVIDGVSKLFFHSDEKLRRLIRERAPKD